MLLKTGSLMTNHTEISNEQRSTCPTQQMSFADVARYLQEGFDEPVQNALSAHIQYCNTCQDELDRVGAIMSTGRHLMGSQLVDAEHPASDESILSEALVAAYIDGGLSENESNLVTQHLADNYSSYAMFTAIEKDLKADISLEAPDRARQLVTAEQPVLLPSYSEQLREQFAGFVASVQQFFELRWPAPALAFAAGVLAMLMFIPSGKTIIAIPGAAISPADGSGRIHSSFDMQGAAAPMATAIALPESISGKLTFSWPSVKDASYRAELIDSATNAVILTTQTDSPEWDIDESAFQAGKTYTLFVTASNEETGIRPVATISIAR